MNKEDYMLKIGAPVIGLLVLILVLVLLLSARLNNTDQDQQDQQARSIAQDKWVQNDLFMNTLKRYNESYHSLKQRRDEKALAVAYLSRITKDLFLLPAKDRDNSKINVMLPASPTSEIYVLREIEIGPDNGLYDALNHLVNRHKGAFRQPPYESRHTEQLIKYIMTGQPMTKPMINKLKRTGAIE